MPKRSAFSTSMRATSAQEPPGERLPPSAHPDTSEAPKPASEPPVAKQRHRVRPATKQIAGHFDPAVSRQLNVIAAEEEKTVNVLLAEALNMLFHSRGRSQIASTEPARKKVAT
jgi:hypothetical protein